MKSFKTYNYYIHNKIRYSMLIIATLVFSTIAAWRIPILLNHIRNTNGKFSKVDQERERTNIDPWTSCGPCSLKIIFELHNIDVDVRQLSLETKAYDISACSFSDLMAVASKHGLSAKAIRFNAIIPNDVGPMIIYIDGAHFATAIPCGSNRIVVSDPPNKPYVTSIDDLRLHWSGEALIFTKLQ
jgi:ABC-type bacteriocin/lantibiotic exporter with double-glycine peptidase domain